MGLCCGPAMNSPSSCKCLHCREFFIPCPNSRHTQRYCPKAECRKASKITAQAKWLNKPQNRCYFRGPENVERVRRWREHHPGYWRKKRSPPVDALQDLAPIELSQIDPLTLNEAGLMGGRFYGQRTPETSPWRCVTRSRQCSSASLGGSYLVARWRCVTRSLCSLFSPTRRQRQARVGGGTLRRPLPAARPLSSPHNRNCRPCLSNDFWMPDECAKPRRA